ncbi:hypothetical protein WN48_02479 [Eufriesea mexicana]|nr:hypothetical protein WN48_02479 [Eufriesea mexicana]
MYRYLLYYWQQQKIQVSLINLEPEQVARNQNELHHSFKVTRLTSCTGFIPENRVPLAKDLVPSIMSVKWMFQRHPQAGSDHRLEPVIEEHTEPQEDHREKRNFTSYISSTEPAKPWRVQMTPWCEPCMTPFFSDADTPEESPCTLIIEDDLIYSLQPRSVLCLLNVLLITTG